MFTKQNTDPENILLWDALQEIMESEREYEAYVTQNVCNDARDSITLTGVWRLHNQVYPYTKTNWMGVVSIIDKLLTTITLFCGYKKYEDAHMITDPDSKALYSFMLVSKDIKEPLRFDIIALNGSGTLDGFLPMDVIYVLKCGCHHITFTMNSLTEFCERYLETFKKFVTCCMLWAWDVDMSHNERIKMVQTIRDMNLNNFWFGEDRMFDKKEIDKALQKPQTDPMPLPIDDESIDIQTAATQEWLTPHIKAYYVKGDYNAPVLIVLFRNDKNDTTLKDETKETYATNVFHDRLYRNIIVRCSKFTQAEYNSFFKNKDDPYFEDWKRLYWGKYESNK